MKLMFNNAQVEELDLRSFDISNITNDGMQSMFQISQATKGYAKTEAARFNANITNRPVGLTFIVK